MEHRRMRGVQTPALSLAEAVLLPALELSYSVGGATVDNLQCSHGAGRAALHHALRAENRKKAPANGRRHDPYRTKSWVTYG